jgi:S-formylglutathione hydrolase
MSVTTKATIASFGGKLLKLSHNATTTNCEMSFNLYLPPQAQTQKVPVLIYLSGLTCTADNCSEKGFFQHGAAKKGIAVLYPDTSPRTSYLETFKFWLFHLASNLRFAVNLTLPHRWP